MALKCFLGNISGLLKIQTSSQALFREKIHVYLYGVFEYTSLYSGRVQTVLQVDWLVWPPSQAVNFFLVPPQFRATFVYFIDLVWYTFNSYIKHSTVL